MVKDNLLITIDDSYNLNNLEVTLFHNSISVFLFLFITHVKIMIISSHLYPFMRYSQIVELLIDENSKEYIQD